MIVYTALGHLVLERISLNDLCKDFVNLEP